MNFEAETDINAAKFEKAAPERTAGESCWSEFGEETAAAHQNFASPAGDDGDFVCAVFSTDRKCLHVLHRLELNTLGPVVRRPSIKQCASSAPYGTVHTLPLYHADQYCQTLSTMMSVMSSVGELPAVKL